MTINKIKPAYNKSRVIWLITMALSAIVVGVAIFLLWSNLAPLKSQPSFGVIYFKWSDTSLSEGETIDLLIRIDPEVPIDTVMAKVKFDPTRLEYKRVSYEGSAFLTQIPAVVKDDSVMIQSAIMGGDTTTSDSLISSLTFEAKTNHMPRIELTGNSARAGEAMNPRIASDPSSISWTVFSRLAASVSIGALAVWVFWFVYRQVISRKGRSLYGTTK